jgi:hypothetical protein
MAAVTKGVLHPVTVPGYDVSDKGQAKVDLAVGDLVIITNDAPTVGYEKVWDKAPITGITEAHGIVLAAAKAAGTVSVGIHGEMDGFSGLTRGAVLYPSTATAGGIDTTAIAAATERIRAVTASRIRFLFL